MTHRRMRRLAPVIGALLAVVAGLSLLPGGAAAIAQRPRCGYHAHVVGGYTVRLHKHRTSGVFAVYLVAPVRYLAPNGSVCINVIARRNLPLIHISGQLGSWMNIVHDRRTIFPGFGGRPPLGSGGVDVTLPDRGTLAAVQRCPRCYTLEVWPLGYHGKRPELSAGL